MGVEEQKEEREVLDSIFPEEITGASRKSPPPSASATNFRNCLLLKFFKYKISRKQNTGYQSFWMWRMRRMMSKPVRVRSIYFSSSRPTNTRSKFSEMATAHSCE